MASLFGSLKIEASSLPMHVLFPEDYARSKRMIVRDFAIFGALIVVSVVEIAYFFGH